MLNYPKLREMQRNEMASSELCEVEEGFYSSMKEYLGKKKEEALGSKNLLVIKEYENLLKICRAIANKRMEKVVLLALRGKKEGGGMTREEVKFLSRLSEIMEENSHEMAALFDEAERSGKNDNIKRIKFTKDITPYKGLDEKVYGPFKTGEEAELPLDEAQWLLREHMAELCA